MIIQNGIESTSLDIFLNKKRTGHLISNKLLEENEDKLKTVPYIYKNVITSTILSWEKLDEDELYGGNPHYIIGRILGYHPKSVDYFAGLRDISGKRTDRYSVSVGGFLRREMGFITTEKMLEEALNWCLITYPNYRIDISKARDLTVENHYIKDVQEITDYELEKLAVSAFKSLTLRIA